MDWFASSFINSNRFTAVFDSVDYRLTVVITIVRFCFIGMARHY